jgi:hypothetical protein
MCNLLGVLGVVHGRGRGRNEVVHGRQSSNKDGTS